MPEFPGGNLELCRYISSNYNTPDNNWFVSHIIFSFVIEKDGTISNKEVIINDDDISLQTGNENITDCIEEWKNTSFEILKRMPIWKSGKKNNENVRVRIRIPLNLDPN
jgi:hypothetical protein